MSLILYFRKNLLYSFKNNLKYGYQEISGKNEQNKWESLSLISYSCCINGLVKYLEVQRVSLLNSSSLQSSIAGTVSLELPSGVLSSFLALRMLDGW